MKLDVLTGGLGLRRTQELARQASRAGLGLVVAEGGRSAFLSCAAAALAAELDLATGVAVAFARSPMVTAGEAWELAEASGGRFRLGLGTQVRAHVERRLSAPYAPPGPRMRDYLLALRAIFRAFAGEAPLAYEGPYYSFSLLPPTWGPGPTPVGAPPVDLAAFNPWMVRLAGELADGIHVHPLNNPTYLRQTLLANLEAGAARGGRDRSQLAVIVPCFAAVGDSEAERSGWREKARAQVAFYGSTPNYAFAFDQLGREGTTARLRERQKAGDLAGMARVVDDELLDHFLLTSDWEHLPERLFERYGGVASRVVLYFAGQAWAQDPSSLERFGEVARRVEALAGATSEAAGEGVPGG